MLMKLLKYDFRFSYRIFCAMCLIILGTAVVIAVSENAKFIFFSVFALILFFFISGIVSIVLVVQNYRKSLYSTNGYLTLTLPVTKSNLILSKFFISMFWFNVVSLVAGLAGCIASRGAMWDTLIWLFSHYGFYASWIVYNLLAIDIILLLYLSITVGQCSLRNRRLGLSATLVVFFSGGLIQILINNLFLKIITAVFVFSQKQAWFNPPPEIWRNPESFGYITVDLTTVLCLITFAATAYAINIKLMKKEINLL